MEWFTKINQRKTITQSEKKGGKGVVRRVKVEDVRRVAHRVSENEEEKIDLAEIALNRRE